MRITVAVVPVELSRTWVCCLWQKEPHVCTKILLAAFFIWDDAPPPALPPISTTTRSSQTTPLKISEPKFSLKWQCIGGTGGGKKLTAYLSLCIFFILVNACSVCFSQYLRECVALGFSLMIGDSAYSTIYFWIPLLWIALNLNINKFPNFTFLKAFYLVRKF